MGIKIEVNREALEEKLDQLEKAEVNRLKTMIKTVKDIEQILQDEYKKLTGQYCL